MREISQVTGREHATLAEADLAMFDVIAQDDAARDALIVPIMHRRLLRLGMILAGSDPDFANPLFHKLDPILDQAGSASR